MGIKDPRLNKHRSIDHRLQQQLQGWIKSDWPPKRIKPINIGLIHHTFTALHRKDNNKSNCLKWLIYVIVFFLNRPGECSITSGEPHPFRWCDIQLYMSQLQGGPSGFVHPRSCCWSRWSMLPLQNSAMAPVERRQPALTSSGPI